MYYRREIDGLRAIAVVPVILFHAGFAVFSGGFIGVDVFFVISGYLITQILMAEIERGDFSIARFYERRARRILPMLFFVILCCIPFALLWLNPSQLYDFSRSIVAVTFFSSNVLFWRDQGYFAALAELKPLLHTWSLAVEEQYYLLFPLLLAAGWRWGKKSVFWLILGLALVSLAVAEWSAHHAASADFYLLPTRAWELFAGSICAFLWTDRGANMVQSGGQVVQWLGLAGLAMIIAAIFLLDSSSPMPGLYSLLPVVGTMLVILFATSGTHAARILGLGPLVGIGLVSYSAYLWHQPLFAFARIRSYGEPPGWLLLLLAASSIGLAGISWRYVEQPFRKGAKSLLPNRRAVFVASAATMAVMTGLGMVGYLTKGLPQRPGMHRFVDLDFDTSGQGYRACDPALADARLDMCHATSLGPVNAVLIGDSHANDKFYGLERNDRSRNWALLANSSCPPTLNIEVEADVKGCADKMRRVLDYTLQHDEIRTVAISFFASYALDTAYAADHLLNHLGPDHVRITGKDPGSTNRQLIFSEGLRDYLAALDASGKQVYLMMDQPELPFFPVDCLMGRSDCRVPQATVLERQHAYRAMVAELALRYPNVHVFDPLSLFCDGQTCFFERDGHILYHDSHHLTKIGSDIYARAFLRRATTTPHP
ncbi:MAG: acyltransferase family protein [Novosphingobium sp.]